MPKIYFAGLNGSLLVHDSIEGNGTLAAIDKFSLIRDQEINSVEIGWDYFLLWKNSDLYISGKIISDENDRIERLLQIPEFDHLKFRQAIPGSEIVTVLTDNHEIWTYNIYNNTWRRAPAFISRSNGVEKEWVVKIAQGRCTVALTNLGHAFHVPIRLSNPRSVEFVDVACGYDHTLLLAQTGDVYSLGMGTRGQLGHGDLEDCDEPRIIEALAGLKIVRISAGGWHSAVVTNQGDLYTWGWNHQGQLGLPDVESVVAIPTVVDFKNGEQETIELNVTKAQCGSKFTIIQTATGDLWGCGSNKFGELGRSRKDFPSIKKFVPIRLEDVDSKVEDFKCNEWGTCIYAT